MNTTISISTDIRDKIKEIGHKGESYDDIIRRIYDSAVKRQLQDLLMDEKGTISAKEALDKAKKKWQK